MDNAWRLTPIACAVTATAAAVAALSWWRWGRRSLGEMGQSSSSGFVVEIAPPKLAEGWQSVPTDDRDSDSDSESGGESTTRRRASDFNRSKAAAAAFVPVVQQQPWRIIVNPTAEVRPPVAPIKRQSLSENSKGASDEDSEGSSGCSKQSNDIKRQTAPVVCQQHQQLQQQLQQHQQQHQQQQTIRLPKMELFARMTGFSGDQYREKVRQTVDRLYGASKVLTPEEAHCLMLALDMRDPSDSLLRVLTSMSNLAAFTANQDLLRECGAVQALRRMLKETGLSNPCKVMLMQCIANMAVNVGNQPLLKEVVPTIIKKLGSDSSSELERMVCIQALTNLSLDIARNEVGVYSSALVICLNKLWSHGQVNLAVLRLLVNFSCCVDLVPHMLAAKAPPGFLSVMDIGQPVDILLRSVTLVLCLCSAVEALSINYADIRPLNVDPFGSELQTMYFALFGPVGSADLRRRLGPLRYHENSEIADKSTRISRLLRNVLQQLDEQDSRRPVETASNLMQL